VLLGLNIRWLRQHLVRQPGAGSIRSLAVLPFENLSHDPEQDYFAEGMSDALTTEIAQIGELRVISRTSAMQYKDAKKPLPQIARELNVDAIMEGSILRSGSKVRVTAQLIQASPEQHLWAKSYESDLPDALSLQSQVARSVADQIRIKLTGEEEARLRKPPHPVDPEAQDAYLRGRYYWTTGCHGSTSGLGASARNRVRPSHLLASGHRIAGANPISTSSGADHRGILLSEVCGLSARGILRCGWSVCHSSRNRLDCQPDPSSP
jgi:TolB-like protein